MGPRRHGRLAGRPPLAVRRMLLMAVLLAGALCWPRTYAVYSRTTTNTGNGITVYTCSAQLLGNPGFETGTPAPWAVTSADEIANTGPRTGSWNAVLDLDNNTDKRKSLAQTVTVPTTCARATFSFWLRVQSQSAPGSSNMNVQVLNSTGGTVLATLVTIPHAVISSYRQYTYDLTAYRGQTIVVKFDAIGTGARRTLFIIDDTSISLSST